MRAHDIGDLLSIMVIMNIETIMMNSRAREVPFFLGLSSHSRLAMWLARSFMELPLDVPRDLGGYMCGIIPEKVIVVNIASACRGCDIGS